MALAMPFQSPLIVATAALCLSFLFARRSRLFGKAPSYPPGPPADPILGHLRHFRSLTLSLDELFHEWAKAYGDVIHLHVLGRNIIVLDSVEAATDLLDKRSGIYSDRPQLLVYKLMGFVASLPFLEYGKRFARHRRYMQQWLNHQESLTYRPIQLAEARTLALNLLTKPKLHENHIGRFATSTIIQIAFGHRILSDDDAFQKMIHDHSVSMAGAGTPGSTLLDFLPFLQHMPSWFPGTYYANYARSQVDVTRRFHDVPFELVRNELENGMAKPCFLTTLLDNAEDGEEELEDIKGAAGTLYSAGAETTSTSIATFVLLMVLHPEIQHKAQAEVDRIVGSERLPEYSDRDAMPYLECIMQEILRWSPPVILGAPHKSTADDVYKGMFIPKGSIIIANAGQVTHIMAGMRLDERVYQDPRRFWPERFLAKPEGNGEPYFGAVFGWGRRICPGRYLVDGSLWICIATILATCDIRKALSPDGKEITPKVEFTSGVTRHPMPFDCDIRPRSELGLQNLRVAS